MKEKIDFSKCRRCNKPNVNLYNGFCEECVKIHMNFINTSWLMQQCFDNDLSTIEHPEDDIK